VSEKFEKGDVVTHAWFAAFPGEYTVTGPNYVTGSGVVKAQQKGKEHTFSADLLTLVRKANPSPQKGDRVRVTSVVEAVVTDVYDGGFQTDGPHYWDRRPDNETRTVQILERAKPDLRPGDVVIRGGGTYLIGDRNVHYTSTAGAVIDAGATPDDLAAWIARDPDGYIHIKHSDLKGFKA
jgi:hypothetical protein